MGPLSTLRGAWHLVPAYPSPLVPTLNVHYPYPTPTLPLPLLADRVKRYITTPILPLPLSADRGRRYITTPILPLPRCKQIE